MTVAFVMSHCANDFKVAERNWEDSYVIGWTSLIDSLWWCLSLALETCLTMICLPGLSLRSSFSVTISNFVSLNTKWSWMLHCQKKFDIFAVVKFFSIWQWFCRFKWNCVLGSIRKSCAMFRDWQDEHTFAMCLQYVFISFRAYLTFSLQWSFKVHIADKRAFMPVIYVTL